MTDTRRDGSATRTTARTVLEPVPQPLHGFRRVLRDFGGTYAVSERAHSIIDADAPGYERVKVGYGAIPMIAVFPVVSEPVRASDR